ncbi:Retrovirus-related Pol polyprotein from transposon opus, partial [Mucuna pruriens]
MLIPMQGSSSERTIGPCPTPTRRSWPRPNRGRVRLLTVESASDKVGQPTPSTKAKRCFTLIKYRVKRPVGEVVGCTQEAQESNRLNTSQPSRDQPLHLNAQNCTGGGCPANKAATKKIESNHPRHCEEGSHQATCSRDHLPHLGEPMVPKKAGMTVIKNQQDEMVSARIQNYWRVCIDYKKLNQAIRKDHFLCHLWTKLYADSHSTNELAQDHLYMSIRNIRIHENVVWNLQCSKHFLEIIFLNLLEDYMEVFMDDFTVYTESFEAFLNNLSKVLRRCIKSNLVLNFEKCHFMVIEGIVLGHLVSARGIEVDKAKMDVISFLSNPTFVQEVRSFLGHAGFQQDRPASVQAAIEGHGLCVRSTLSECISEAEEKTHVCAHPSTTKLGASIQVNVRHVQLYARSSPRQAS